MKNEIEPFAWAGVVMEDGVEKETVFMKTKNGVELVIREKYPEADEVNIIPLESGEIKETNKMIQDDGFIGVAEPFQEHATRGAFTHCVFKSEEVPSGTKIYKKI